MEYSFDPVKHKLGVIGLVMNMDCNLNCKMCEIQNHLVIKPPIVTAENTRNLIRQFKSYNPNGLLHLQSGELHANRKRFNSFVSICKEYGQKIGFVTNGTLIKESDLADIRDILGYIAISLESNVESVNDFVRGKGVYQKVLKTIDLFNEIKIPYLVNTVISKVNVDHLTDIYDFLKTRDLFVHHSLNILSHSFFTNIFTRKKLHDYYNNYGFISTEDKSKLIGKLEEYVNHTKGIRTSFNSEYLKNTTYFVNSGPGGLLDEPVCNVFERFLDVSYNGDIRLCHEKCFPVIGNIKNKNLNLKELWESEKTQAIRKKMSLCRKTCGLFDCNNKEINKLQ